MYHEKISTDLGYPIPQFPLDGQFHHFSKDKKDRQPLWAIGHEWMFKDNNYHIVNYGDFQTGKSEIYKSYDLDGQTKKFTDAHKVAVQTITKIADDIKQENHIKCRNKWGPIFANETHNNHVHEYLEGKQITDNFAARVSNRGALLIPVYSEDGFEGVQTIAKKDDGKYEKKFSFGLKIKGSFCPVNEFQVANSKHVYLCEGFATGCSVYLATQTDTICCFTANNILPTVATIRSINPNLKIIIAADDDFKTKGNPGKFWANKAAQNYSNILVKLPTFSARTTETDFNDLHKLDGLEVVKTQLDFNKTEFNEIILLGYHHHDYYYLSTQTLRITNLTAAAHTPNNLLGLADHTYWGDRYAYKKNRDGSTSPYANFDVVIGKLLAEQREVGFYQPENVRGYGCWIDNKSDVVVNLGDRLMVNGKMTALNQYKSKYFYQASTPIKTNFDEFLSDEEGAEIISTFKKLCYRHPGDYILLCSWIALAQIPGALDWRPHIWLSGQKGTGKSEILGAIATLVFRSKVNLSITAASIRQHLKHNSHPMMIDEIEPNSIESKRKIDGIIEVIRQTSSRLESVSMRGSADGNAVSYMISSIYCLSSIQTYVPTSADQSRFHIIEMLQTKGRQTAEEWRGIRGRFDQFDQFTEKIFSRMVTLIPIIRANVGIVKQVLAANYPQLDARGRDQYGTSIAGFWALFNQGNITASGIYKIMEQIDLDKKLAGKDDLSNESENCLRAILGLVPGRLGRSLGRVISEVFENKTTNLFDTNNLTLGDYGIKILPGKDSIFIASNNSQLKSELDNTMYHCYAEFLLRHDMLIKTDSVRINGKCVHGMKFSIKAVCDEDLLF